MIEDPPLIMIRREISRPSSAQLEALRGVPTGFIVDALGGRGATRSAIKPVIPAQATLFGVAIPCHAGPADNLAVFAALTALQPGDVLVVATDGFQETAVTGDLLLGMARNRGATGFVTDGCVRDLVGIEAVGLPCFAAGVTANSPARMGPGTVNLPILLGGLQVDAGDIVIGDVDGIVVVPFARIDAVIERLASIRAAEADLLAKVEAGLGVPDFVTALMASGRVVDV